MRVLTDLSVPRPSPSLRMRDGGEPCHKEGGANLRPPSYDALQGLGLYALACDFADIIIAAFFALALFGGLESQFCML